MELKVPVPRWLRKGFSAWTGNAAASWGKSPRSCEAFVGRRWAVSKLLLAMRKPLCGQPMR
jgi:hypothetical protein